MFINRIVYLYLFSEELRNTILFTQRTKTSLSNIWCHFFFVYIYCYSDITLQSKSSRNNGKNDDPEDIKLELFLFNCNVLNAGGSKAES
jgi:hypothetical protein